MFIPVSEGVVIIAKFWCVKNLLLSKGSFLHMSISLVTPYVAKFFCVKKIIILLFSKGISLVTPQVKKILLNFKISLQIIIRNFALKCMN